VSTESLRSVYFRQMTPKRALQFLNPNRLRETSTDGALRFHWQQIVQMTASLLEYLTRRALCLYPKSESGSASSKLRQLALARSLGFRIPDTYLGNDLEAMRGFLARHEKVISKPFHPQSLRHEGRVYKTYTSLLSAADLEPFSRTRAPLFLQEGFVDKTDIRVGIVGNRLFATEIKVEGLPEDHPIVDFRGHYMTDGMHESRKMVYAPHSLPPEMEQRCVELIRRNGLQYSMMDLLLLPDGTYVFLESNTKGMHGEVEHGGHDVMGAVVDLLLDPDRYRLR
jgi:hypothetical protein